ncbi:unnamed protein product [Echinostoma caproni]|uniref:Uncharacterized protein n=1 Tax=Echinostoma caproni TaxID=27848 RepID=A0A183B6X5_9TREM|nr:unnamed protein product [Echinostoma caproni]
MEGFKLTKWMYNSRHAIDCIPVDEQAPSLRDLQGISLSTDKALGVQWDSEKDEFLYKLQLSEKVATRRKILSLLAQPLRSSGVRRTVATVGKDSAVGSVEKKYLA